jgi:hypothetical protein
MAFPFEPNKQSKGPNFYDIREDLSGFESKQECIKESQIREKALITEGYHPQAEKLAECTIGYRCTSPACPRCSRRHRGGFYHAATALSNQYNPTNQRLITLVYYSGVMTTGQLKKFDPTRLQQRLRKQLERCGFRCPVIGGLEIDYHEDIQRWVPHFHLLIVNDVEAIEKLRGYFKKEKRSMLSVAPSAQYISRPMLVQRLKNPSKQISYLCKQRWQSIHAYRDKDGKRRTSKRRLDKKRFPLSLKVLDQLSFSALLFLYKSRVRSNEIISTSCQREKGENHVKG